MSERPILFNGEMVRAILDGCKTQTRRVVKLRDGSNPDDESVSRHEDGTLDKVMDFSRRYPHWEPLACPYGNSGDRLWVRETWAVVDTLDETPPAKFAKWPTWFKSDDGYKSNTPQYGFHRHGSVRGRWRPSIHMPRWASRLTLEVTGVRVERVQDISRGEAMLEGCPFPNMQIGPDPREWFAALWEEINGPRGFGWEVNPLVWVVEFKRLESL